MQFVCPCYKIRQNGPPILTFTHATSPSENIRTFVPTFTQAVSPRRSFPLPIHPQSPSGVHNARHSPSFTPRRRSSKPLFVLPKIAAITLHSYTCTSRLEDPFSRASIADTRNVGMAFSANETGAEPYQSAMGLQPWVKPLSGLGHSIDRLCLVEITLTQSSLRLPVAAARCLCASLAGPQIAATLYANKRAPITCAQPNRLLKPSLRELQPQDVTNVQDAYIWGR